LPVHLAAVSLVLLAALAWAGRNLLPETAGGAEEAPGESARERPAGAVRRVRAAAGALRGAAPLLLALSLLLMAAGAIEDSAASWGAVYMRTELDAAAFLAGMPFVACQAMMTLGRLTGDRLTDRFGAAAVVRAGALVSAAGVAVAVLVPSQAAGIAGFGLLGLGVATLFPLTLAAAGAVPGVRSGDGVAVVGWLGRVGFLVFPPMIGAIADAASLGAALWTVGAAGRLAGAVAGAVRRRRGPCGPGRGEGPPHRSRRRGLSARSGRAAASRSPRKGRACASPLTGDAAALSRARHRARPRRAPASRLPAVKRT